MGQMVIAKECDNAEHTELDLGTLASGLYTVFVRVMDGTVVNKVFVKE